MIDPKMNEVISNIKTLTINEVCELFHVSETNSFTPVGDDFKSHVNSYCNNLGIELNQFMANMVDLYVFDAILTNTCNVDSDKVLTEKIVELTNLRKRVHPRQKDALTEIDSAIAVLEDDRSKIGNRTIPNLYINKLISLMGKFNCYNKETGLSTKFEMIDKYEYIIPEFVYGKIHPSKEYKLLMVWDKSNDPMTYLMEQDTPTSPFRLVSKWKNRFVLETNDPMDGTVNRMVSSIVKSAKLKEVLLDDE